MKNIIFLTLFTVSIAIAAEVDPKLQLSLPENIKAELLFTYPKLQDKDFTHEDANRICREYQNLFYRKYFYIICKTKYDEIYEKEFKLKEHEDWILMGISVTETQDHWGYYRRTESPIFKKEKFLKWELDEINKRKILSLAVWGLGNFETEKEKVVYPGKGDAAALEGLSFDSKADAWLSCLEILEEKSRAHRESMRFERAQCKLEKIEDKIKYRFKIVSQNPFL